MTENEFARDVAGLFAAHCANMLGATGKLSRTPVAGIFKPEGIFLDTDERCQWAAPLPPAILDLMPGVRPLREDLEGLMARNDGLARALLKKSLNRRGLPAISNAGREVLEILAGDCEGIERFSSADLPASRDREEFMVFAFRMGKAGLSMKAVCGGWSRTFLIGDCAWAMSCKDGPDIVAQRAFGRTLFPPLPEGRMLLAQIGAKAICRGLDGLGIRWTQAIPSGNSVFIVLECNQMQRLPFLNEGERAWARLFGMAATAHSRAAMLEATGLVPEDIRRNVSFMAAMPPDAITARAIISDDDLLASVAALSSPKLDDMSPPFSMRPHFHIAVGTEALEPIDGPDPTRMDMMLGTNRPPRSVANLFRKITRVIAGVMPVMPSARGGALSIPMGFGCLDMDSLAACAQFQAAVEVAEGERLDGGKLAEAFLSQKPGPMEGWEGVAEKGKAIELMIQHSEKLEKEKG